MARSVDTFPRSVGVIGLVTALAGWLPVLYAVDVFPSDDGDFGAPRWIVALISFSFVAVGGMLAVLSLPSWTPAIAPDSAWVRRTAAVFAVLLLISFFGGAGAFLNWKAFMPGVAGRAGVVTVDGMALSLPPSIQRVADRFVVTLFALIFDAFVIAVAWQGTKALLGEGRRKRLGG